MPRKRESVTKLEPKPKSARHSAPAREPTPPEDSGRVLNIRTTLAIEDLLAKYVLHLEAKQLQTVPHGNAMRTLLVYGLTTLRPQYDPEPGMPQAPPADIALDPEPGEPTPKVSGRSVTTRTSFAIEELLGKYIQWQERRLLHEFPRTEAARSLVVYALRALRHQYDPEAK